jgi:hypothetical protein
MTTRKTTRLRDRIDPREEAEAWLAEHAPDFGRDDLTEMRGGLDAKRDEDTGETVSRQYQEAERYGSDGPGRSGTRMLSLNKLDLEDFSADLDCESVSGAGLGGDYDEADGPPLAGRYVQRDGRATWLATPDDNEASAEVRAIVATLPATLRDVFDLLYVERLNMAEAGWRLGISKQAVQDRARRLRIAVEQAMADRGAA